VQAVEALLSGVAQVEVGEQPPHGDRQARSQRAAIWLNQPIRRVSAMRGTGW
jgi:hypothetical protein